MKARTDFFPAEKHYGDKRCLHEEGQQALDGQRRAEDVAHKP